MKRSYFTIFVFLTIVSFVLISCSITRNDLMHSYSEMNMRNDSVINQNISIQKWGVDLSRANFGTVYLLNPVMVPTDHTIAGFTVTDTLPRLKKEQKHVLRFLLTSNSFYHSVPEKHVKTIFAPYLAIRLTGCKRPADYLLISYGGEEWALVTKDVILKKQGFKNRAVLIDFGLSILPNDKYLESIK